MGPQINHFSQSKARYVIYREESNYDSYSESCSFDKISEYIKSCPAAQDQHSKIIIEENAIYFGHSLKELEAAFPRLPYLILTRSKSFSEDNIRDYGYATPDARLRSLNPIGNQQGVLKSEARKFFASFAIQQSFPISGDIKKLIQPEDILLSMLDSHDTVAIGEVHQDHSSKKLLVDHMAQLKAKGVDAIYLEHVFYDTQKDLFDAYFASATYEMPVMLKNYLQKLDRSFSLAEIDDFHPYSFLGLVIQAKRYGIRIIPIDTVAAYSTGSSLHLEGGKDPADRCLMMNYVAAKNFNTEKSSHQKAIFFVGSAHLNNVNSGIPGIAEITHSPTLVVEDIVPNRTKFTAETHSAQPDLLIRMDSQLSEEASGLKEEYDFHKKEDERKKEEQILKRAESELSKQEGEQKVIKQILTEETREIKQLREAIKQLKNYGHKQSNYKKREATLSVAQQLNAQLSLFMQESQKKVLNAESYKQFNGKFKDILHSKDGVLGKHQAYWKIIIANIAIALTGLGALFLGAKLLYSHATTGKATLFFDKTASQGKIEAIDEQLKLNFSGANL